MSRRSYGSASLLVRADRNGRQSWYGKWRHDGRQVKRRLGLVRAPGARGDADTLTRAQAEARLRDAIAEHAGQAAQLSDQAPDEPGRSFAELADAYLENLRVRGRKASTIADVRGQLKHWLRPYFAGRAVEAITRDDVKRLVVVMLDGERPSGLQRSKPPSAKTIRNVLGNLSAMLGWAEREGWRRGNPARGIDLPGQPASDEIRWLSPDEVRALAAQAIDGPYQHLDRPLYLTAAMTGLRQGELFALRWRDVDWQAGAIRVRRSYTHGQLGTPKSRRSARSVPMADDVAAALEILSRAVPDGLDDLVFPHPLTGGHLASPGTLRRMRRALADAGLDDSHRFHDLRHTFGTQMAARGVPMRTLQEWMGHKDLATTQRYADYAPRHDERALVQAAFASRGDVAPSLGCGTGVPNEVPT